MTSSYLYFIVPVVAVVLALKCCLLCWRIHYNQQRRRANLERQAQLQQAAIQRSEMARAAAMNTTLTRIVTRAPDGTQQVYLVPTAGGQRLPPSAVRRNPPTNCRTILITPEDLGVLAHACRRADPNLPPTYDQAVTGRDKSVKVEEGTVGGSAEMDLPPDYSMQDEDSRYSEDSRPLLS